MTLASPPAWLTKAVDKLADFAEKLPPHVDGHKPEDQPRPPAAKPQPR